MRISIPREHERQSSPENVNQLINTILKNESEVDREKEHFWLIGLKSSNTIKFIELVHLGGLDRTTIDIKVIMRTAVYNGVASIIIAHNHPGGTLKPSDDDLRSTKAIKTACDVLEIVLLDHVINADGQYFSMKEGGILP